jgi:hypothetical protein
MPEQYQGPSDFSSNIKGIINMTEKKFQNLKSHYCHVLIAQWLPVALREMLDAGR